MDEVDLVIEGMERELHEYDAAVSALGDRLAAGQNQVRPELNAAIRQSDALRSNIYELKRQYDRFSPIERFWRDVGVCGCGGVTSGAGQSPEERLASQREVAPLELQAFPEVSALPNSAVAILALAWNDPRGAVASCADLLSASPSPSSGGGRQGDCSPAEWRRAVEQLEELGLVQRGGLRFERLELTLEGYRIAGMIYRGGWPPQP